MNFAGGGFEVIECGDGLVKFQVLGSEEHSAFNSQAIVDDDSLVGGHSDAGFFDAAGNKVAINESSIKANQDDSGLGGFAEESGTAGKSDGSVLECGQMQNVEAAGQNIGSMLDGHPTKQAIAVGMVLENTRPLRQEAQSFVGRFEEWFCDELKGYQT